MVSIAEASVRSFRMSYYENTECEHDRYHCHPQGVKLGQIYAFEFVRVGTFTSSWSSSQSRPDAPFVAISGFKTILVESQATSHGVSVVRLS